MKCPWKRKRVIHTPDIHNVPGETTEQMFEGSHVSSITFTIDRLPYLKNLLAAYELQEEKHVKQRLHDAQLRGIMQPFVQEFGHFVRDKWSEQEKTSDAKWLQPEDRMFRIIGAYAGDLLTGLEKMRADGWDGKGFQYDGYADQYRFHSLNSLRSLVQGLEAGHSQVTLNIPAELQAQYEVWFTSTIEWAIREGKVPAAGKA